MLKFKNQTIEGIITATSWMGDGSIAGVKVCADGERNYTVSPSKEGARLFDLVTRRVEVVGDVIHKDDGAFFINVTSFKLLDHKEFGISPNVKISDFIRVLTKGGNNGSKRY